MSETSPPVSRPADGFDNEPQAKRPRVAPCDPALKVYDAERLDRINTLFAAKKPYKMQRADRGVRWELAGNRLKLMNTTTGAPAKMVAPYGPFTVFPNNAETVGTPGDAACKWRVVVTVPLADVRSAEESDDNYAAATGTVQWVVDMRRIYGGMLLEALQADGVAKQLIGAKVSTLFKKKPMDKVFDDDLNRAPGERPVRFSVPISEGPDTCSVGYNFYVANNPTSTAGNGPTESSEEIVAKLAGGPPSVMLDWCKSHPERSLKSDVFSTPNGWLPLSDIVSKTLIKTPKCEFAKMWGTITTGGHGYSFAAKPSMFTAGVFPTDGGVCMHSFSPPGSNTGPAMSTDDAAVYAAVADDADVYGQ